MGNFWENSRNFNLQAGHPGRHFEATGAENIEKNVFNIKTFRK